LLYNENRKDNFTFLIVLDVPNGWNLMKKMLMICILLVLAFSFSCTGCQLAQKSQETKRTLETLENGIEFWESEFSGEDWAHKDPTIQVVAIPDKETALAVASALFKGMQKQAKFKHYEIVAIWHDTDDGIWIIVFAQGQNSTGGFTMALREDNAQIINIWAGE
jgi:hypothetical protein